jgi:hypothetical protein
MSGFRPIAEHSANAATDSSFEAQSVISSDSRSHLTAVIQPRATARARKSGRASAESMCCADLFTSPRAAE